MTKLVADGPLDEALYAAAPIKVLHLLKQVNSTEANWSLSQFVSGQVIDQQSAHVRARFPVWLNLAWWSHLLQQGGAPQFHDVGDSGPDLATALKSSAVVNLMSELGGANTDPRTLLDAARREQSGWARQIQELRPSCVIYGSTFWVLQELKALPAEVVTSPLACVTVGQGLGLSIWIFCTRRVGRRIP